MQAETQDFVVEKVERSQSLDRTLHATQPLTVDGIKSISLTCKHCAAQWRATKGDGSGKFNDQIGGVYVACPKCGAEGAILKNILV